MARIRTIKPEFCTSEQLVECSTSARLLFVLMWMFCDDRGVHPAKARQLKMECFPGDPFTVEDVEGWIEELLTVGLIEEFLATSDEESDAEVTQDVRYWHVTGWDRHQRIDRPAKPKHPEPQRGLVEDSSRARRGLALEGKGKERKGKELKESHASNNGQIVVCDLVIPPNLDTPEFRERLGVWVKHRSEIHKPLKPTSFQQQMLQFAEWGQERSIRAIDHTVAMGWQGIREPDQAGPGGSKTKTIKPPTRI